MQSYGCVKCQNRHYEIEDIYKEHLLEQSKHGISKDFLLTAEERIGRRGAAYILRETNELARQLYRLHDRGGTVAPEYRFDLSEHPQEIQCWQMACAAQQLLTETDLEDVLSELESC